MSWIKRWWLGAPGAPGCDYRDRWEEISALRPPPPPSFPPFPTTLHFRLHYIVLSPKPATMCSSVLKIASAQCTHYTQDGCTYLILWKINPNDGFYRWLWLLLKVSLKAIFQYFQQSHFSQSTLHQSVMVPDFFSGTDTSSYFWYQFSGTGSDTYFPVLELIFAPNFSSRVPVPFYTKFSR